MNCGNAGRIAPCMDCDRNIAHKFCCQAALCRGSARSRRRRCVPIVRMIVDQTDRAFRHATAACRTPPTERHFSHFSIVGCGFDQIASRWLKSVDHSATHRAADIHCALDSATGHAHSGGADCGGHADRSRCHRYRGGRNGYHRAAAAANRNRDQQRRQLGGSHAQTPSSSTSNRSVAPGGITPPAPRWP